MSDVAARSVERSARTATPTWDERAPLRGWYAGMWVGIGVFSAWSAWDGARVSVWWPLAITAGATLAGPLLGYKLRMMDPVSWAMGKTAFIAR